MQRCPIPWRLLPRLRSNQGLSIRATDLKALQQSFQPMIGWFLRARETRVPQSSPLLPLRRPSPSHRPWPSWALLPWAWQCAGAPNQESESLHC